MVSASRDGEICLSPFFPIFRVANSVKRCDKVKKWSVPGTGDFFTGKNHKNRFPAIFMSEKNTGIPSRRHFQVKISSGLYSGNIFK